MKGFSVIMCVVLLGACAEEPPPKNYTDLGTFAVALTSVPAPTVPLKPITLAVELEAGTESLDSVTAVSMVLTLEGQGDMDVAMVADAEAGAWRADATFPSEGEWAWTLSVTTGEVVEVATGSATVACTQNSPAGSGCCEDANCASGLLCVVATCQEGKNANEGTCLGASDCESDYCFDGSCAPMPTCTDELANGDESDVDCGGATCDACVIGLKCGTGGDCDSAVCEEGVCVPPPGWQVGTGDGTPGSVDLQVVLSGDIYRPADLDFNPEEENELWIVSPSQDKLTVVGSPGSPEQSVVSFVDSSRHFLEEVVSISFGPKGEFATCGDSNNSYDGFGTPNNFMGPSLWPSSVQDFQTFGPDPAKVHLDMLHSTPNCMGIANDGTGRYFAYNGYLGTLDWYDFGNPHSDQRHGGEDHSDGVKRRYVNVAVFRVAGVPSHMAYHKGSEMLYIADTGNKRVLKVFTGTANVTGTLPSFGGDGVLYQAEGEVIETVASTDAGLVAPSGIAVHDEHLFVTDNATGIIHVFTLEGAAVRTLDTGLGNGALAGIAVNPFDGKVYFVDRNGSKVYRVNP